MKNETNPQEDISIDDFRSLSKQVVTNEDKSSRDSRATLIEQEPDAKDVIENKMEDIAKMQDIVNLEDPALPKEVPVNDNTLSDSHAITIKPEPNSESLSCATCLEEFPCEIELERHVKAVHWRQGLNCCQKCGKQFPTAERLSKHLTQHTRIKPFVCPHCQRAFFAKNHLRSHIDSVHKKLRPYFCTVCKKYFANKQGLAGHIDTVHKKLKPFSCHVCQKSYAQKGSLDEHLSRNHGTIQEGPKKNGATENKFEVDFGLSKDVIADDKASPESKVITIQPERHLVSFSCAVCLEEFMCVRDRS